MRRKFVPIFAIMYSHCLLFLTKILKPEKVEIFYFEIYRSKCDILGTKINKLGTCLQKLPKLYHLKVPLT